MIVELLLDEDRFTKNFLFYSFLALFIFWGRSCIMDNASEICDRLCQIKGRNMGAYKTNGLFGVINCWCGDKQRSIPMEKR
jgi:hypothetical protein